MSKVASWFALIVASTLVFSASSTQAFVDPPTFNPSAPNSSQPIVVSVRNGVCDYFGIGVGAPPMRVEYSPGIVDVIAPGVITFEPFCIADVATDTFAIGALAAGNYQVRIWIIDATFAYQQTTMVSSAPLTVTQGPVAQSIPTLGFGGLVVLIFLMLLGALYLFTGRRRALFFVAALIGSTTIHAQETPRMLMVLLSGEPGTPTPQMLVEPVDFSAGYLGVLSPGFTAQNPIRAFYLIRERATGDYALWLENNPEDELAKLERYVIVTYPDSANLQSALAALDADPNVVYAAQPEEVSFSPPPAETSELLLPDSRTMGAKGTPTQPWVTDLGFSSAWARAGGWSLVATLDNGLYPLHSDLVAFNGGSYTGGNLLSLYAVDVGRSTATTPVYDVDVDELQPVAATFPICDPDGDGLMVPTSAGHGTHVAGLIGANQTNADGTVGACKNCGIAPIRVSIEVCRTASGNVIVTPTIPGIAEGLKYAASAGVQIVNQSFGFETPQADRCAAVPNDAICLALKKAIDRGILVVGASGNNRKPINFPGEDPRVVAVGGLEPDLTFWDDRLDLPASILNGNCPDRILAQLPTQGDECGSNFTPATVGERRQEVTMSAREVYSTMYPAKSWNPFLECGDSFGDANATDGRGLCTGTSMSAPLYSGMAGILRSINPLLLPGNPENAVDAPGIRDAVVDASVVPGGTLIWDAKFGYGIPRVDAAASIVLGFVAGNTVKNRVTPLFSFYGAAATDWAYTTVPQAAIALAINVSANYTTQGTLVAGYSAFPESPTVVPQPPAPRANTYVLTTEFRANTSHPNLIPLYWMDRKRNTPIGCGGGAGCNENSRDFLLLTTVSDVEFAKADGYGFRGLQGYVYNRCTPEPSCIPLSAEKLYRKCYTTEDDCAIFLESERVLRESEGYTAAYPVGSNMHIGYAYPNVDTDADGLINGFERIIGTRHDIADSDGDGVSDGVEFPLAGIRVSDPCQGPNIQCANAPLFANSFE